MNRISLHRFLIFGILGCTLAVLAAPPALKSIDLTDIPVEHTPEATEDLTALQRDSIAAVLDSIRRVNSEVRLKNTNDCFKRVSFMLYEGELESNLYPAAFEANSMAIELLDSAYDENQSARARSILMDLNPVMMHGAVYWSGQNNSRLQADFARAYLDTQLRPEFAGADFDRHPQLFPRLAYAAAFGATSAGDTEAAKQYFEAYLSTDDLSLRQNVIKYYGQACSATGDYAKALDALEQGALRYPTDMEMLTMALQACLDGGMTDRMQPLLEKALMLNPNEEKLQNLQAQLFERNQDYRSALDIYLSLAELHPNSLELHQHIATCYYNLGASHYNASIMDEDDKVAARHRRQSKSYFASAATALGHVLANTPSDMKYLRALAHTYAAMGEREKFDEANRQIRAFHGQEVTFNSMPALIGGSEKGSVVTAVKVPSYEEFARPYIEKRLGEWGLRGEFEKLDDYKKRLAGGETEAAYLRLNAEAEEEYLKQYARQLVIGDLKRSDYDIDNEVYRIDTPYGATFVKVPVKNHEAEAFKAGWETAQIRAPRFIIKDDKVALGRITYVVNGKKYTFNSDDDATYTTPSVYVDINGILAGVMRRENGGGQQAGGDITGIWKDSDVDVNIPVTGRKNSNLHALIIANENYQKTGNVFGALHDGHTFREYCVRTLGIPESQAVLLNNATGNQIRDALATLARRVKGNGPGAEVIFFYAGHGLPDDATKEAYMMPVDANPLTISTLIPMKDIYAQLGSLPSDATSVFIDACFSGTNRDGVAINEARGVALKAKEVIPQGNMFVLTAASAQETALPYKEKQHGLFTYFLLKKLQESKGNATLRDISNYVISNVQKTSDVNLGKSQTPTATTSGSMTGLWDKKTLKP